MENVFQAGAFVTGDDADPSWEGRQGLFPGFIKKPFGSELFLQSFQSLQGITDSIRLDSQDRQLDIAPSSEIRDSAGREDFFAFFRNALAKIGQFLNLGSPDNG